ncbi:MAG: phosphodiester glycosidase family protein [Treponemataceae bacterium]|nr:phosphodiester glycosidase family protein [Treponemataceae bacterium]
MNTKKLSPIFFIFSLFIALFLTGCASHPIIDEEAEAYLYPRENYIPESFDWQEVAPGIDIFDYENPDFPIIYHAVRIDLTTPGLELVCTPENTAPTETETASATNTQNRSRRQATSSFAAQENCLVAINATPFDSAKISGIHMADGKTLSSPIEKYAALAFQQEVPCPSSAVPEAENPRQAVTASSMDDFGSTFATSSRQKAGYSAKIFASQNAPELEEYDFAFGGFFIVLEDGEVCYDFVRRHTSRTGAGLSADGRTLYILVAEGERPWKSEGLSYPQCGELFKAMGCTDALEFDGGGSTELCIKGRSILSYSCRRTQANSWGFRHIQ